MNTPPEHSITLKNWLKYFRVIIINTGKALFHQIVENRINFILLFLALLAPIAYELLEFFVDTAAYDEYLRTTRSYLVLDEFLTVFAQKVFGTVNSIIGVSAALFYTFGFLSVSAMAYLVLLTLIIREKKYRQREPYIYIALTVIMFTIDMSGYWFFPTAPPIRIFPELHYRILVVPLGDSLISIKYNALPSGHIWALTVPYIASKAENLRNWEALFGSTLIITSWVVVLTGDHYIIDSFLSYFLCIVFYVLFSTIHDYRCNNSKLAPKSVLIKRYVSLIAVLTSLLLISIITLEYTNDYILIIQLFCILFIWPLIVIKTDMKGLLDSNYQIQRSSIQDYKDFFSRIMENSKKCF